MGTIISWIEYTYEDYKELCLVFSLTPLDINNESWIDHYEKLKEALRELNNQ